MVNDFFQTLATQGRRPNYSSTTYEAYIDDTGKRRVRIHPEGFAYMGFADINSKFLTI